MSAAGDASVCRQDICRSKARSCPYFIATRRPIGAHLITCDLLAANHTKKSKAKEAVIMSILVGVKVFADTAAFRKALSERADEFQAVSSQAQAAGAIHHRFGIDDEDVFVTDEWTSKAAFDEIFSNPELQTFISSVGGNPAQDLEITIGDSVDSPDQF